ncbi:hypothetical protein AAG570_007392 [Ranatra chinensis]|uniref:Chitin-binding type-2 domain-containing protein n=1 Tax=Ranatra chinensis TaxID=642074 RepID=A0ABD0XWX6_9HEMI
MVAQYHYLSTRPLGLQNIPYAARAVWAGLILASLCALCVYACTKSETRPYPFTCHSYLQCDNGSYVKKSCPFYKRYWDVKTERCAYWEATCGNVTCVEESNEECPSGDATQYYRCVNGTNQVEDCPEGERFDPQTRRCSSTFVCVDGRKSYVNCKNYKECSNNTWVPKQCPIGQKFDQVTLKCVLWGAHCTDV